MPDYSQPQQQGIFGGVGQNLGGMFGNLHDRLHPYANRLMIGGLGMLGGGVNGAMRGLVAGSVLDKEDADKKRLDDAIAQLSQSESGIIPDDPGLRALMAADPKFAEDVLVARLKPADVTDVQQNYQAAVGQGYTGTLMDFIKDTKASGVTINTGDYKLPPKYRYKDPNNPDAGVELIPGVATDRSESEQKGDVLLATVEPDYQTALTTYGALSDPVGLAASYGGNLGRYFQSGEFQSGSDAITSIAQSYIYAISGAQAPEQEVRRISQLVMPALNDKTPALELKKKRLGAMVQAIRAKTGAPPLVSPEDWTDVGGGVRIREMR